MRSRSTHFDEGIVGNFVFEFALGEVFVFEIRSHTQHPLLVFVLLFQDSLWKLYLTYGLPHQLLEIYPFEKWVSFGLL